MKYLILSLALFSTAALAKPLPDVEEPHFIAYSECGNLLLTLYYDSEEMIIVKPRGEKSLNLMLELRDKAGDNAKVIRKTTEECPEI